jgi:NAD-dependent DNA ligase
MINAKYQGKYKNARNFVAGQMNREIAIAEFYPNVDLVAYTMIHPDIKTKIEEIEILDKSGFKTPAAMLVPRVHMTEENMVAVLKNRREASEWQLDGLVIGLNEEPKTTVKFKVGTEENVASTEVLYVEWNTSKDGYLKPRVSLRPVQLMGVTVSWCSGFNAKYIVDNKIGPGAVLRITRSGDVIPFILAVELPAQEPDLPECEYVWTDTGVDIRVFNSFDAKVMRMVHCFGTLGVFGSGEGIIRKMMEAAPGIEDFPLKANIDAWDNIIGANGEKIYKNLLEKLKTVSLEKFADAVGVFGRGVGERKLTAITDVGIDFTTATVAQLINVPGIEKKTAEKIVDGQPLFKKYLPLVPQPHNPLERRKLAPKQEVINTTMSGSAWCFTGFRDALMEQKVKSLGGSMSDSKFTVLVCKDPSTLTSKKVKAMKLGAEVIDIAEARRRLGM